MKIASVLIFTLLNSYSLAATAKENDPLLEIQTLNSLDIITEIEPGHVSPFCSSLNRQNSVLRASLPNMHEVLSSSSTRARILRSNSPYKSLHVEEIIEQGIGQVIVYKSFSKASAKKELNRLYRDNGYSGEITHLPLDWRAPKNGSYDSVKACQLTMKALQIVRDSSVPVLVHCTVGEDRTGLLAGLMRVAFDGWTVKEAFQKEMCERGYEAGNHRKSENPIVISAIRDNLTPLYLKMSALIKQGKMEEKDCDSLTDISAEDLPQGDFLCSPVTAVEKICTVDDTGE